MIVGASATSACRFKYTAALYVLFLECLSHLKAWLISNVRKMLVLTLYSQHLNWLSGWRNRPHAPGCFKSCKCTIYHTDYINKQVIIIHPLSKTTVESSTQCCNITQLSLFLWNMRENELIYLARRPVTTEKRSNNDRFIRQEFYCYVKRHVGVWSV